MPVTIERVSLMTDGFVRQLTWKDVIGLSVTGTSIANINIEIETSGVNTSMPPIKVQVTSRLANAEAGPGTITTPLLWDVPQSGPIPGNIDRCLFRISQPIASAGLFLASRQNPDVATIVRVGGTSDASFRTALKAIPRGRSTQPARQGVSTEDETQQAPDALQLLQAAGVEVLTIEVAAQPGWPLNASRTSRLIRHPARVVYYSGHGLSVNNCLGIETGPHQYACWAGPGDLTSTWKLPECLNLDIFVIAGCSLLKIDTSSPAAPTGIGLQWAPLLTSKGGPLLVLLGYAASAPSDDTAGNAIASEMGARLAQGTTSAVQDWLAINGRRKAWNAVGIDNRGYWWMEPRPGTLFGHKDFEPQDIRGPVALP